MAHATRTGRQAAGASGGRTPEAGPASMTAVVHDRYGSADVLRVEQVHRPTIAADEVLIRVRAAGVDRGTWHLMAGLPYPIRLAGFGVRRPKNRVPGMDVAGTVEAVGRDVTRFQPGDEVFGIGRGTFAQYAAALESKLAPTPPGLTAAQAAVVGVSGVTALQAVRDEARVHAGQSVLVVGASGGVGSYAVQIAVAAGAEVTGVASTGKLDLVRSLGAAHVVDHTREDFWATGRRYDAILDVGGNTSVSRLRRALTPRGTLVIVGGEGGSAWGGGLHRQLWASVLSVFSRQRLGTFVSRERGTDLLTLAEMVAAGEVTPVVDSTFGLAEAADAIRYLVAGSAAGKVAVTV